MVKDWLGRIGVRALYIEKASPWKNGYNEFFNGKCRDEPLNGKIFYGLAEARVLIKAWRWHYNTKRPHSLLGIDRRHRNDRNSKVVRRLR